MAMAKTIDEASVEKKLLNAKNTQESIQSLCLWALHHKAQHENIVKIWLSILKKSKIQRRLTLFYLCNEIVQTCKRKHAIMYKDAFKEVLREAVLLVRDNSVRTNIERIFSIWEERNIYDSEFIEDLIAHLNNAKIRPSAAKLLAEFKPNKLRENIASLTKIEKEAEAKRRRLSSLNIDVTSQNYMKLLKDRSHGKQYTQQIEDSHRLLEDYVNHMENEIKERQAQQELLEQSELFYDAQYGEAKIVTNAYKNFGTRVTNLRKKLDDVRKTLPDPLSPIPSPTMDAPSPVESVVEVTEDNTEPVDMEMSDGEDDGHKEHKAYSPSRTASSPPATQPMAPVSSSTLDHLTTYSQNEVMIKPLIGNSISLPSAPENLNSPSESPVATDSLPVIDYNSSFLSKIPSSGLTSFSFQFNNAMSQNRDLSSGFGSSSFTNDDSQSGMADDDGGGTPVQDEKPETSGTGSTLDPVALLNQLLSCTKKPASGGTDILKSLSALTKSMKVPFKSPDKDEKSDSASKDGSSVPTTQQSKVVREPTPPPPPTPQFQPFYHSDDYLPAQPHSSSQTSGSAEVASVGENVVTASAHDSSYASANQPGSSGSNEQTLLLPPPLPPAFNFSTASAYPPVGQFESSIAPTTFGQMPFFTEPTFTGSGSTAEIGNSQGPGGEGILNMRPDLVEMLKNVLNTTKTPATSYGQGAPDVVDPRALGPPIPEFPEMPAAMPVVREFHSNEDNGDFVERLKKKTGFPSPIHDPLSSPKHFQQMLNTGQQRICPFPPENEFQGVVRDPPGFHGPPDPNFSHSNDSQMRFDSYESHGMPMRQFPPGPMHSEEIHPIPAMVPGRNSDFAPEFRPRGFAPDFVGGDRNGPHDFNNRPGINRFSEPPFFNARPKFPHDFNQGGPARPFGGGPPSRFPPMHQTNRFASRGYYPPY